MKILMINSVCGIRSTGRICTDLAAALADVVREFDREKQVAFSKSAIIYYSTNSKSNALSICWKISLKRKKAK